ncbi:hypothetical protein VTO42DRAFT_6651 [Malbranchea cinnamomea]
MDPSTAALLLDPKAYKKQSAKTGSSSRANIPSPGPQKTGITSAPSGTKLDLQFLGTKKPVTAPVSPLRAKAASINSSMEGTEVFLLSDSEEDLPDGKYAIKSQTSAGTQASMIESMYGVEERQHRPAKRIKLNGGQPKDFNTSLKERFRQSGNALLRGYMKESSSDSAPPPTPSSETLAVDTIDLTVDNNEQNDDDDVIFIANEDVGAEEVCYGKLEGAKVYAHQVPVPPKSVLGNSMYDWPSIRCELVRQRSQNTKIEVTDPSNEVFGTIDPETSAALAPLLDTPVMKLRTQARLDVRRRRSYELPGQPCAEVYRISINLYGPRKMGESVGRFLGQKNVWLGTPNSVEAGYKVVNPHAEKRLLAERANSVNKFSVQSETRTAEEISSAVTKMFDQLQSAENLPEMERPDLVKTPLLPHQKQALWYMTEKEKPRKLGPEEKDNNSLWRIKYHRNGQRFYQEIISGITSVEEPPQVYGGLLADMMGLGKTLSILSLVCSTLPESLKWAERDPGDSSWFSGRTLSNVKTTLLIVPLSTVGNWISQIKEHLQEGAVSYYVFHGPGRTEDPQELAQYDIVITTYSTVLSDIAGKSSKRGESPLTQMNFFRIVLDEAHAIREQNAAQSQAIFRLEAQRRWSVTGTPIQNRLEDLGSVTKFLRLYPYNERGRFAAHIIAPFKSESSHAVTTLRVLVDSFTLRRVKDRINLPPRHDQTVLLKFSEEEKKLHEFFRKESNVMINVIAGQAKEKMTGKMYHLVLKAMMILRQISAHGKELLDPEERERFRGLSANDAIDLEAEVDVSGAADQKAYEMLVLMKESSADTCAKCGSTIAFQSDENGGDKNAMVAAMLPCYDLLCVSCFAQVRKVFENNVRTPAQLRCVFCRGIIPPTYTKITTAGFEQAAVKPSRKQVKVLGQYEGPHTKTKALISHLLTSAEENKQNSDNPPIKSVVFSAWTSHLDLIEIALEENGLRGYTRLDGTMSLKQRNEALAKFNDDGDTTILLATIGAGGVGLNLTAASRVYIMEPQYNPAAVTQAIDRVHRIGQKREVTTVQFIMKDSIEEKIADLAKRKQKLADMSLNRSKDKKELQAEKMKEYRNLFK